MKVVVLGESSADEAAVRVLVDEILRVQTTGGDVLNLRARGWPAVRGVLSAVIKQLHYRTDVEGLVVLADSNARLFTSRSTTRLRAGSLAADSASYAGPLRA